MTNGVATVEACPNCDSPNITARETKTPTYRCKVCTERFPEPTTRPNKNQTYGTPADRVAPEVMTSSTIKTGRPAI